jgi:hypothetical protein
MRRSSSIALLLSLCLMFILAPGGPLSMRGQSVPREYQRFFVLRTDQRSRVEKALNWVGKTNFPVGRSFALIAGVTQYPTFRRWTNL